MARKEISTSWDGQNRNAMNDNFKELYTGMDTVTQKAIEEISDEFEAFKAQNDTNYKGVFDTEAARDAAIPNPLHGDTATVANEATGISTTYRYVDATVDDTVEKSGWIPTERLNNPSAIRQLNQQLADKVGNGVKAEPEDLSERTLALVTGEGTVNLLSIPQDKSVTPEKLSFSQTTRNIFNGKYYAYSLVGGQGAEYITPANTSTPNPTMVMIPVKPSTEYTFKVHDPVNRFRVALTNKFPLDNLSSNGNYYIQRLIISIDTLADKTVTFTTDADTTHVIAYLSNEGSKPRVQLEEGARATNYIPRYVIPSVFVDGTSTTPTPQPVPGGSNVVIEDGVNGYPSRPNLPSVIWIGVNEPPNPEPYDEWRQVEGFTYFTNFSEYTAGTTPEDWTPKWNTFTTNRIETANGENMLLYKPATMGISFLSWDDAGTSLDSEIYVTGKTSGTGSASLLNVIHRGIEGARTGYIVGARFGDTGSLLSVSRSVNGTLTRLKDTPVSIDFTQKFHMVSRLDGGRIRAKIWQDGQTEPTQWIVDITDTSPISGEGKVGVYGYLNNIDNRIYKYGVGTNGMKAPRRKVTV